MSIISDTANRLGIAGELLAFLWDRKMWWMIPIVAVMLFFGLIIGVGSATGVGPFIYTLF